ncbi:NUDIX hydrolase [Thermofilum pendens]|uniref:NUDIX hydrolase n=1 Tax=Thermofilum pendens (strain DSM 2475 / Hrk 5) TaxID=368408 RepID=A1S0S1_THEPD|nr:NUDIX hydrolase [Thermofilum pendens]ABL79051.1 NUDIX hydrolase [Thermofilum pendens Hrk 5]
MYPAHAVAAVSCVVKKGGKFLLVKRGKDPGRGLWAFPGGVIEAGEGVFDAAKRELYEETGLSANPLGVVGVTEVIHTDGGRVKHHYVILSVLFDEESLEGSPRAGGDVEEVAWMSLDEILGRGDVVASVKALSADLQGGPCTLGVYTLRLRG